MAIVNQEFARRHGGRFEVQIDDSFCPFPDKAVIESILEDLEWLGICPRKQVLMHRANHARYLQMLDELEELGRVKVRRHAAGCCVAKATLSGKHAPINITDVSASSCRPGVVGHTAFYSDARHIIDPHWIAVAPAAIGWRQDTFWCSDPAEVEPWVEFDLPKKSKPDTLQLTLWLPRPREVEVLALQETGGWQRVGYATCCQERHGDTRWWAAFDPPPDDLPETIPLDLTAMTGGVSRLRLCFRGLAQVESYELPAPAGGETIVYHDLCLGERIVKRTQPLDISLVQFARSASDVLLRTTHVIRGDELEGELNSYVQCMQAIGQPLPTLCHLPHLVDEAGDKLSKSFNNAPRLAEIFRGQGVTPTQARAWIIANAYKPTNANSNGHLHSFADQMKLLADSISINESRQLDRRT